MCVSATAPFLTKKEDDIMPNKVLYNGEEYFVMDVYYYGKGKMKYKLDDGHWVESEKVEIVD